MDVPEIDLLRKRIDGIDAQISDLMAQRLDAVREISAVKLSYGLPISDSEREDAVVEKYRRMARHNGMSQDISEQVCRLLISESVMLQQSLAGDTRPVPDDGSEE